MQVRKVLERVGHSVVDEENGNAGLHQLKTAAFDLFERTRSMDTADILSPQCFWHLSLVREDHASVTTLALASEGVVNSEHSAPVHLASWREDELQPRENSERTWWLAFGSMLGFALMVPLTMVIALSIT
jgi:hypothetical protein